MLFIERGAPWGRLSLRTWGQRSDERLKRLWEKNGNLNDAIMELMSEGFHPRQERIKHNMVVDDGFNLLLNFLQGSSVSGIQYVALGSATTAPVNTDHTLGNEVIRIQVSSFSMSPNDLTVTGYFDETMANVLLGEAGLFGNGASIAANSGTLYSHVTFNPFTKNNLESLTAQWDLGFQRPS